MKLIDILSNDLDMVYTNTPCLKITLSNGVNYALIPICEEYYKNSCSYKELPVKLSNYTYGGLVDTFIKMIYSDREMTAIINNYLLDPTDENIVKEFNEMQEVRKEAKELAKEILEKYPLSSL